MLVTLTICKNQITSYVLFNMFVSTFRKLSGVLAEFWGMPLFPETIHSVGGSDKIKSEQQYVSFYQMLDVCQTFVILL